MRQALNSSCATFAALLLLIAAPALADSELAKRDWSTSSSGYELEKYPPSQAELSQLVNRTIDSSWTMGICSFKFVDVYDGTFRLVASLDTNGRHFCNRVVVIEKTGAYFHVINDFKTVMSDQVNEMLADLDKDHSPELIVTEAWSRPETGHCLATWQKIYKWRTNKFVDDSASYPAYYKNRLKDVRSMAVRESDPTCHLMEADKINRFLGNQNAGADRAAEWMKSTDASLRRKAATVFADIRSDSAKKNLILLSKDKDPLVAESAQLYIDKTKAE
jgi:hypothetical protein